MYQICPDLNRDADEVEVPHRHRPEVPEEETSDHRGDGAADHAAKMKNDCSFTLKSLRCKLSLLKSDLKLKMI